MPPALHSACFLSVTAIGRSEGRREVSLAGGGARSQPRPRPTPLGLWREEEPGASPAPSPAGPLAGGGARSQPRPLPAGPLASAAREEGLPSSWSAVFASQLPGPSCWEAHGTSPTLALQFHITEMGMDAAQGDRTVPHLTVRTLIYLLEGKGKKNLFAWRRRAGYRMGWKEGEGGKKSSGVSKRNPKPRTYPSASLYCSISFQCFCLATPCGMRGS